MTKDAYGNYVVQKFYENSDNIIKCSIWKHLKEPLVAQDLMNNTYGIFIYTVFLYIYICCFFLNKKKVKYLLFRGFFVNFILVKNK
jgi:hypothetical protein